MNEGVGGASDMIILTKHEVFHDQLSTSEVFSLSLLYLFT